MQRSGLALVLSALVASGALGCGGDDDDDGGPSQPPSATGSITVVTDEGCAASDCGGNLAGRWAFSGGCYDAAWLLLSCPEATYTLTSSVTGGISFEGGQLSRELTATTSGTVLIPPDCLRGTVGCDTPEAALPALDWISTAECTAITDTGCECEVTGEYHDSDTVTYSSSGSTYTTGSGQTARTFQYCVEARRLRYMETTPGGLPVTFELEKR